MADDLDGVLSVALQSSQGVNKENAGALIRLACQIETLNRLAAETWEVRSARATAQEYRSRPVAADG